MKTQIIGLGNPILSDDGIGVHILQELMNDDFFASCILTIGGTGGAALLDMIEDCDQLIIIDAIQTGAPPGTIFELSLDDIKETMPLHFGFLHGMDFFTAINLKKQINCFPLKIKIVAVEAANINIFSEECTDDVKNAIKPVKLLLKNLIK